MIRQHRKKDTALVTAAQTFSFSLPLAPSLAFTAPKIFNTPTTSRARINSIKDIVRPGVNRDSVLEAAPLTGCE